MNAFNDPKVTNIVMVAASQVGKSEFLLNCIERLCCIEIASCAELAFKILIVVCIVCKTNINRHLQLYH